MVDGEMKAQKPSGGLSEVSEFTKLPRRPQLLAFPEPGTRGRPFGHCGRLWVKLHKLSGAKLKETDTSGLDLVLWGLLSNVAQDPDTTDLLPARLRPFDPSCRPSPISGISPGTGQPQAHLLESTSEPCCGLALALHPGSSHRALTSNSDQVPTLIPGSILGDLRAEPCFAFTGPLTD